LHPFWEKKLGFEIYDRPQYIQIGELMVRLEHGDEMNPDDEAYKKWRAFTRHPFVEPWAHVLPGFFWDKVGEKMSEASRKKSRAYRARNEELIKNMIRTHAVKVHKEKPFDILISGHMHVKVDEILESEGTYFRNINLGSWLESPQALCIEGGEPQWLQLD
jgi:UDP-2,3-diacylglucosamine hydrolase